MKDGRADAFDDMPTPGGPDDPEFAETDKDYAKEPTFDPQFSEMNVPTDQPEQFTEKWVNEIFDLLGTSLEVARETALAAVATGTGGDWFTATKALATVNSTIDLAGKSFGIHAMKVEIEADEFLGALSHLLGVDTSKLEIIPVTFD